MKNKINIPRRRAAVYVVLILEYHDNRNYCGCRGRYCRSSTVAGIQHNHKSVQAENYVYGAPVRPDMGR